MKKLLFNIKNDLTLDVKASSEEYPEEAIFAKKEELEPPVKLPTRPVAKIETVNDITEIGDKKELYNYYMPTINTNKIVYKKVLKYNDKIFDISDSWAHELTMNRKTFYEFCSKLMKVLDPINSFVFKGDKASKDLSYRVELNDFLNSEIVGLSTEYMVNLSFINLKDRPIYKFYLDNYHNTATKEAYSLKPAISNSEFSKEDLKYIMNNSNFDVYSREKNEVVLDYYLDNFKIDLNNKYFRLLLVYLMNKNGFNYNYYDLPKSLDRYGNTYKSIVTFLDNIEANVLVLRTEKEEQHSDYFKQELSNISRKTGVEIEELYEIFPPKINKMNVQNLFFIQRLDIYKEALIS